jgi:hypothetical protein
MNRLLLSAAAGLLWLSAGCNDATPDARLNAPPHGEPTETRDTQGTFVYMGDNALLANMTVTDTHFLPHRAQLSSLGQERVMRLASLMEAYGGVIRFSSDLDDEKLVAARIDTLRNCLTECGLTVTTETVARDLPGGDGMRATETALIRASEGTYNPKKKKNGGATASDKLSTDALTP